MLIIDLSPELEYELHTNGFDVSGITDYDLYDEDVTFDKTPEAIISWYDYGTVEDLINSKFNDSHKLHLIALNNQLGIHQIKLIIEEAKHKGDEFIEVTTEVVYDVIAWLDDVEDEFGYEYVCQYEEKYECEVLEIVWGSLIENY